MNNVLLHSKARVKSVIVNWTTYVYFNIEALIQFHARDLVGKKDLPVPAEPF